MLPPIIKASFVRYSKRHIIFLPATQHGCLETQGEEEDNTEDDVDLEPEDERTLEEMMEKLEFLDRRYAHLVFDDDEENVPSHDGESDEPEVDISPLFEVPLTMTDVPLYSYKHVLSPYRVQTICWISMTLRCTTNRRQPKIWTMKICDIDSMISSLRRFWKH